MGFTIPRSWFAVMFVKNVYKQNFDIFVKNSTNIHGNK